jgi:hypothetical protein
VVGHAAFPILSHAVFLELVVLFLDVFQFVGIQGFRQQGKEFGNPKYFPYYLNQACFYEE